MFINKIDLSGKAFNDAERRGNGPVRFVLTQGGGRKKDSEERWPTEFFNIVAWPETCESAESVKKGDFLTVSGRLRHSEYTSNQEGSKRRTYEVVASAVEVSKPQKPITPARGIAEHIKRGRR